jgi:hypothetical protein
MSKFNMGNNAPLFYLELQINDIWVDKTLF